MHIIILIGLRDFLRSKCEVEILSGEDVGWGPQIGLIEETKED